MSEYVEGQGIRFTDFLKPEKSETTSIPEVLSGEEVGELGEKAFQQVSVHLGCHLVDSNVVLTLAGLKPMTEFTVQVPLDEDIQRLEKEVSELNQFLSGTNPNIKFSLGRNTFDSTPRGEKRVRYKFVSVQNLLGYERVSKTSKLPGVTPFDRTSSWIGFVDWSKKVWEGFNQTEIDGHVVTAEEAEEIMAGFERGYPDIAILDVVDWVRNGSKKEMQDSQIPNVGLYKEAEPQYIFYSEHADDPAIGTNEELAGKILRDFYKSEWHNKVAPLLIFHRREE